MVYMGGLTFDSHEPSKWLKLTNLVAGLRSGYAILSRVGLYDSMTNALHILSVDRSVNEVLTGDRTLMLQRDVGYCSSGKSEEQHRDSIWYAILEGPAVVPRAKYRVSKVRPPSVCYCI